MKENYNIMEQNILNEIEDIRKMMGLLNEMVEEDDSDVVVNVNDISSEDMGCFRDASTEEAKAVGLNHGGKYKVKKKGCRTKTKYKGPKTKYYRNNGF
jgi:hypothetical protein